MELIETPSQLDAITPAIQAAPSLAVDAEAAGFHRYSDQICLLQVSTPTETFVLDPLALDLAPVLRQPLEDPSVQILMHGGDYDIRLLDRDLGIRPKHLFDTQIAAGLLGENALGLSALLEQHLGVTLAKKYQRADWAKRPLTDGMLEYAAADTAHLHDLVEILRRKLVEAGRLAWAQEEFQRMEEIRWAPEPEDLDPVARVKQARGLEPRELERLRVALEWRDEIARERDRALFRVAGDSTLVEAATSELRGVGDLVSIKGFPQGLARSHGPDLLERLAVVEQIPPRQLKGYPRPARTGPGRPTPEEEDRFARLKNVRNGAADELGLARGVLMANGVLEAIARANPRSVEELERVEGVRTWQIQALGDRLVGALAP